MSEYKRLTMINNNFIDTNCRNCKQCKIVGRKYICNDMTACNEEIINRLAELEDKIEQGTLIELPCKVGDMFYGIETNTIFKYMVLAIKLARNNEIHLCTVYDIEFVLGKDAFLTKAEAEQRLKELEEKQDER